MFLQLATFLAAWMEKPDLSHRQGGTFSPPILSPIVKVSQRGRTHVVLPCSIRTTSRPPLRGRGDFGVLGFYRLQADFRRVEKD